MAERVCQLKKILVQDNQAEKIDYEVVRKDISNILRSYNHEEYNHIGPILVRLAWHSSGTYCKHSRTGGSNGATMRFHTEMSDPDNGGLKIAQSFLEPIKIKYPNISYSDLWVLASYVALEDMGLDRIEFIPGRKDATSELQCPPNGRLPDPSANTCNNMRSVFSRLGFNDEEMVALIGGGHTLGKCHIESTGYDGVWTEQPTTLSNLFFNELFEEEWIPKKIGSKNQFVNPEDNQMMLPADLVLRDDPTLREYSLRFKDDNSYFKSVFKQAFKKLTELGFVQF